MNIHFTKEKKTMQKAMKIENTKDRDYRAIHILDIF